eukprot:Skav230879  [mRNA]  locus=scaffold2175:76964:107631:- [translate_table: standard]
MPRCYHAQAGTLEPSDGADLNCFGLQSHVFLRDEKASTPKAGDSIGATPVVLGLPIGDRRETGAKVIEEEQDEPRSPQCMTSGPQFPATIADEAVLGFAAADDAEARPVANLEIPNIGGMEAIGKHPTVKLVHGPKLWCQQFDALFRKRALSVRRDRRAWASQLLLPSIFVFLALLTARWSCCECWEAVKSLYADTLTNETTDRVYRQGLPACPRRQRVGCAGLLVQEPSAGSKRRSLATPSAERSCGADASMTPLMYCVEPVFSVPSTAYVTLICLNIFTGTISTLAIAVLEAFDLPELEQQPELCAAPHLSMCHINSHQMPPDALNSYFIIEVS